MRRLLAWLVALPLMAAGSQVAHALAYRWAYPNVHVRMTALVATGHGYLAWMPLVLGIGAAGAFLSLLVVVLDAASGREERTLPAWAFALLPPLGFTAQEILERSFHAGSLVWQAVEAPTFLPGIALQVPFAAAAYLAARFLLRAAARAGAALAVPAVRRPPLPALDLPRPAPAPFRLVGPLGCWLAERGPPRPLPV